jgi:hypothetical protein
VSSSVLSSLKILNCTCKDAASLISQQDARKLSWAERAGLRIHLILCRACRRYLRSVRFLSLAMKGCGEDAASPAPEAMPAAARERIQKRLIGQ